MCVDPTGESILGAIIIGVVAIVAIVASMSSCAVVSTVKTVADMYEAADDMTKAKYITASNVIGRAKDPEYEVYTEWKDKEEYAKQIDNLVTNMNDLSQVFPENFQIYIGIKNGSIGEMTADQYDELISEIYFAGGSNALGMDLIHPSANFLKQGMKFIYKAMKWGIKYAD